MPFDAGSPVPSLVLDSPLPTHPFPWLHALDQDGNANGEITYSSCWRHRTCCPLVLDPTHRQPQKASPAAQTTTKLHQRLLPVGRWRPTDPFVATSTLASWSWIWLKEDSKLSAHDTAISDLQVNFPTAFQSVSLPSPIPQRPVDWTMRGDDRVPSEDLISPPKRVRFARTPILKYPDDFLHPSTSRHTALDHRHASDGTSASEYIDACLRLDSSPRQRFLNRRTFHLRQNSTPPHDELVHASFGKSAGASA
jgi:hypothetical protein